MAKPHSTDHPCESTYSSTLAGCCEDGRRCDEICIAVIASQECKQAHQFVDEKAVVNFVPEGQSSYISPDSCCENNSASAKGSSCYTSQESSTKSEFATSNEESCAASKVVAGCETAAENRHGESLVDEEQKSDPCCVSSRKVLISSSESSKKEADDEFFEGCSEHLAEAMRKYKAFLEQGICICRNAIEQLEVCCSSANRNAILKKRKISTGQCEPSKTTAPSIHSPIVGAKRCSSIKKSSKPPGSCTVGFNAQAVDDCCTDGKGVSEVKEGRVCSHQTGLESAPNRCLSSKDDGNITARGGYYSNPRSGSDAKVSDVCSSAVQNSGNKSHQKCYCLGWEKHCSKENSTENSLTPTDDNNKEDETSSCSGPKKCCSEKRSTVTHNKAVSPHPSSAITQATRDVEQNAAREHVVFSIAGMTCTGCVKKVLGVLADVDGVENVKVNFVAGTGGFDTDTFKISAPAALHRLEKETGFKCKRVVSNRQTLDLTWTSTTAQALAADFVQGVVDVERVSKAIYRVHYDPFIIGARSVLAASGGSIAPPGSDSSFVAGQERVRAMTCSCIGATVFTIPVCVLAFGSLSMSALVKGLIELVLATFVQLIAIPEFYVPALKALIFSKTIEMDMLVVISITAAYGYSIVAFGLETSGINLEQGPLFETSTLLITLVLLGRLVAGYAKIRAVQTVSLRSLQAEFAMLETANGVEETDARLLELHDVVRVPAHSRIVSDGEIISGQSAVDESMLTGEALPIPKATGDTVTAGTLNGTGVLRIKLTRLPGRNSITDIADLVQNALEAKPRVQDLADVVAGYFVPVVVTISVICFAVWVGVAVRIRGLNAGGGIGTAITYAIAVLAVSCPCALGLAVPLVSVISGGVAARGGVIIKQANAIERGFKVTDVVLDKTGTLTTGQLEVVEQVVEMDSVPTDTILAIAYSLVKDDAHPVAQAVRGYLKVHDSVEATLVGVESIPGSGARATWHNQEVRAGNPYWLNTTSIASVMTLQAAGHTLLCLTVEGRLLVSFGLKAVTRPEAPSVVKALQLRGLTCHIVSGDQPTAVANVVKSLGIHIDNVVSRQSPADKQGYIEFLRSKGKTTLFCGDGTNDAVAIAAADVGVQIGSASDVSRATANVVLLGGLEGLIVLLEVSQQSFYRIIFNFVWSGVYNVFAMLLASGAFVKVRIAPNYAGLGEIISVLPVVFVALTMLKIKTRMS